MLRAVVTVAAVVAAVVLPFPFPLIVGGTMNPKTLLVVAAAVLSALIVDRYVGVSRLLG